MGHWAKFEMLRDCERNSDRSLGGMVAHTPHVPLLSPMLADALPTRPAGLGREAVEPV